MSRSESIADDLDRLAHALVARRAASGAKMTIDRDGPVGESTTQASRAQPHPATSPEAGVLRFVLALAGRASCPTLLELQEDELYLDHKISRSTINCLLVLAAFDGEPEQGLRAIAKKLGMSVSGTLRYLRTWLLLGVLEQNEETRQYRLVSRSADDLRHSTGYPSDERKSPDSAL